MFTLLLASVILINVENIEVIKAEKVSLRFIRNMMVTSIILNLHLLPNSKSSFLFFAKS